MFKAINTELQDISSKIDLELTKLELFYNDCLNKKEYTRYFDFTIQYDENKSTYETGKGNMLYHYVNESELAEIDGNIQKYGVLEYQLSYFAYIERLIGRERFQEIFSLLKVAEHNGWTTSQYWRTQDKIRGKFYGNKTKRRI